MDASTRAIAEAQAAQDRAFMDELNARHELASIVAEREEAVAEKVKRVSHAERVRDAQNAAVIQALQQVPLNREQRRAQVKAFGRMLRLAANG